MVRSRKGIEHSDSDFRLIGGMTFEEIQNCESKMLNLKLCFRMTVKNYMKDIIDCVNISNEKFVTLT